MKYLYFYRCQSSIISIMRYIIKVIPRAKKIKVEEEGEGRLRVHLTAPPVEGKANTALIECLAEYFGVKKRQIKVVKGLKSREKLVEIEV